MYSSTVNGFFSKIVLISWRKTELFDPGVMAGYFVRDTRLLYKSHIKVTYVRPKGRSAQFESDTAVD